jgi:hypothetical protein
MKDPTVRVTLDLTQEDLDIADRLAKVDQISNTDAVRRAIRLSRDLLDERLQGHKILIERRGKLVELIFNN